MQWSDLQTIRDIIFIHRMAKVIILDKDQDVSILTTEPSIYICIHKMLK